MCLKKNFLEMFSSQLRKTPLQLFVTHCMNQEELKNRTLKYWKVGNYSKLSWWKLYIGRLYCISYLQFITEIEELVDENDAHLTPRNWGFSPGAAHSDSSFSELTWLMESTVAATNQGKPKTELNAVSKARMKRSRWYPPPFCKIKQEFDCITV